jgi:hypothetical protein
VIEDQKEFVVVFHVLDEDVRLIATKINGETVDKNLIFKLL